MKHINFLFLCLFLCGTTACGSNRGESVAPTDENPPSKGTASGLLIVPPDNIVEIEPNDAISQAQPVVSGYSVLGNVATTDSGFTLQTVPAVQVEDLYSMNVSGRVRITLSIAEDDLDLNDLDLFLMDNSGNVLDASEGVIGTEFIQTSTGGNFIIGVRAFAGSSAYVLNFASLGGILSNGQLIPLSADFVPGEIFVKMKPRTGLSKLMQQKVGIAGTDQLTHKASFPQDVNLMRLATRTRSLQKGGKPSRSKLNLIQGQMNPLKGLTLETIRKLRSDPDVIYAEANFIRKPLLIPNDQFYSLQWHYPLIRLPQAWDVTTGSDDVIIAVLDTGVLSGHPDISSRLIAGYDFISDTTMANDGDGIDANPDDPGDDPQRESSSFHGTHVAGTIGASTNNTSGVAGVTWQSQLMPLRELGVGGGTDADIIEAIRYAAGLPNSSGTLPPTRANIINMSLGGPGFSQTLEDAVKAARSAGVVVVASAGNDNVGDPFYPASYDNVISVSAVDIHSEKAPYSNFGSKIDVAAPGGNNGLDLNGDTFPDGVLSVLGDDAGNFVYWFYTGTSMAAPHVAGTIALMLSENTNLTPNDIDRLLDGTHPNTMTPMTQDLGEIGWDNLYGHGLIDASKAVLAAQSLSGNAGSTPSGSALNLSTNTLNFNNFIEILPIKITNSATGSLQVTNIADDVPWLTATPDSGEAPLTLNVTVDRSGLAEGVYNGTVTVVSDAETGTQSTTVNVAMTVGGNTTGNIGTVFVLFVHSESSETIAQVETNTGQNYFFMGPEVDAGSYTVVAGTDRDNDGLICDIEDACGSFPGTVTISVGSETTEINFIVGDLVSPQKTSITVGPLQGGRYKRLF